MKVTKTELSCGAVYYAVQGGSNLWVCGWNLEGWPFQRKLSTKLYFVVVLLIVRLTFVSRDKAFYFDLKNNATLDGHQITV